MKGLIETCPGCFLPFSLILFLTCREVNSFVLPHVPTIVLCFILDQKARDLVNNTIQAKNLRKQTQALFLIGQKTMFQLQRLGGKRTHFSSIDFFIQAYK